MCTAMWAGRRDTVRNSAPQEFGKVFGPSLVDITLAEEQGTIVGVNIVQLFGFVEAKRLGELELGVRISVVRCGLDASSHVEVMTVAVILDGHSQLFMELIEPSSTAFNFRPGLRAPFGPRGARTRRW